MIYKPILVNMMWVGLAVGIGFLIIPAFQIGALSIYSFALSWVVSALLYKFWRNVVKENGKDFYKILKFLFLITFIFLLNHIPQALLLQMVQNGQILQIKKGADDLIFEILIRIVFDGKAYTDLSIASKLFIGVFFTHLFVIMLLIVNIFSKTEKFVEKTVAGNMFKSDAYTGVYIFITLGAFSYWVIINAHFTAEDLLTVSSLFYQNLNFIFLMSVACFATYIRSR